MELAFITPTSYLEQFSRQGDFYLALAHLIDDNGENEYACFHRREAQRGRPVFLDNGLFEGAQVEPETLIHRARAVGASVVCAPDVLYDSKGTIKAFKQFIRVKQEKGLVCKIMGIPQADNPVDWWECFQFMDLHPECDLLGLSILSIPQSFKRIARDAEKWPITASRMHLIKQLFMYTYLSGHHIKPCHLLGLGEHYGDVILAKHLLPETILTNDSSSAFLHGVKGVPYNKLGVIPGGKDHEKLDFDTPGNLSEESLEIIQHNIDVAKDIKSRVWI